MDALIAMGTGNARMKLEEDYYRRLLVLHYLNNTQTYTDNNGNDQKGNVNVSTLIGNDYLIDVYHEAALPRYNHASIPLSFANVIQIAPTYQPTVTPTKPKAKKIGPSRLKSKQKQTLNEDHSRPSMDSVCICSETRFREEWKGKTKGIFDEKFNWNNIIVAGGAVLSCLMPSNENVTASDVRKVYLTESDIDIFIHSLSHEV
jgi:hypothetical protein